MPVCVKSLPSRWEGGLTESGTTLEGWGHGEVPAQGDHGNEDYGMPLNLGGPREHCWVPPTPWPKLQLYYAESKYILLQSRPVLP